MPSVDVMQEKNEGSEQAPGALLDYIRPAVREEAPYLVGQPPGIGVKLNQNESPYDLPPSLKDELLERFSDIPFNRYPDDQPEELRHALAEHTGQPAESIVAGNGSNELVHTLGQVLIAPGTPVVLPRPMFALYAKVARLHEADLVEVPSLDDLRFDTGGLIQAIERHQPALVILALPNNPTGRSLPFGEIRRIVAAAPGFVVIDEAYTEFKTEPSALELLDTFPNVVVLRTFSKAFGLAGLRVGYLVARPEVARELLKERLPFMVDRFSQEVALALLDRPDLRRDRIRRISRSAEALAAELREMSSVEVVPSQANFMLFRTPLPPGEMLQRLAQAGVLVRDVSGYDQLDDYLRVTAGTPQENKAFLAALKNALSEIAMA